MYQINNILVIELDLILDLRNNDFLNNDIGDDEEGEEYYN